MSAALRILPVLVGVLLVAGFLRLGQWQADRGAFKEALFARFDVAAEQRPVPLAEVDPAELEPYTPVNTGGRWLADVRIFLENQLVDGRDGVHLFVPLVEHDGTTRLVNLGWQPVDATRRLPEAVVLPGANDLAGMLAPPPATGVRLGELALADQESPFRVPWLDLGQLGERLNLALAPQILLATDPSTDFRRSWRPATMPAERHYAYAFQWKALATAVAILTGWGIWRLTRRALQRRIQAP